VTITATLGAKSASVALEVLAQPGVVALSLDPPDLVIGQTDKAGVIAQATLVGALPAGGLVFSWTSSNPSVATVAGSGETGTVTAVAAGVATITATGYGKSASVRVTVGPRRTFPRGRSARSRSTIRMY